MNRAVDLATMPLYVRGGSIIPLGAVKQFTGEKSDAPLALVIYPNPDASCIIYEDDGQTFNYRRGESMKITAHWNGSTRRLSLSLAPGSRMLPPLRRKIEVRLVPEKQTHSIEFSGKPVTIQL